MVQRPFTSHGHEKLEKEIVRASPNYPVTQPPVSMPCLHAITSLLEKDRRKRIGAIGFETFTDHSFFRRIDFEALEKKQIPPVFIPSSEKTNFDATYDLEELLLEEAPLEARARRQKPRVQLKEDATDKEIRVDELHRMIETLFEPFDYTTVKDYKGFVDAPSTSTSALDMLDKHATTATNSNHDDIQPPATLHQQTHGTGPETPSAAGSPLPHTSHSDYFSAAESASPPPLPHGFTHTDPSERQAPTSHPGSAGSAAAASNRAQQQQQQQQHNSRSGGGTRTMSKTGGAQVTLDETGSWGDLSADGAGGSAGGSGSGKATKPNGMLGFLSRKKGRERSPKPMEAGVLGKEGARVVVGGGR